MLTGQVLAISSLKSGLYEMLKLGSRRLFRNSEQRQLLVSTCCAVCVLLHSNRIQYVLPGMCAIACEQKGMQYISAMARTTAAYHMR